jgi:thioredoxin-related protein
MKKLYSILSALFIISLVISSCKSDSGTDAATEVSNQTGNTNKTVKTVIGKSKASHNTDHLNTGGLKWTTFDALPDNKEKKKYIVDVYTEWCGWCKVMDKKTFTDPKVQEYLNENFHMIKFDAEQKDAITFKGRIYDWKAGGRNGYNTLAKELLGNRMSYPTMVYLDENMNKIQAIPGYKKPDQLMAELKAINESL